VEHYRLKADSDSQAGRWLAQSFYEREGRALPSSAKKDVLENLIAKAASGSSVFPTGRRVLALEGRVFLDLCNPEWEVVEVTPQGWFVRPASEVPVRFTRAQAMLALPHPAPGGMVDDLRPFFNCGDEDFRLVLAWILTALSGGREYPVLVFGGEPGSAKSTATRYARALVDPNAAPLRTTPREDRDLFITASNGYVLTFDNVSTPPDWLPDVLCAIALGTGYACRSLYTDDQETIFQVASPIILNSISEQLTRSDLADRSLSVTLHRIHPEQMKPRDKLDAAFDASLPGILGALLEVLSSALEHLPRVQLETHPRMAQTARLLAAAEPSLGWPEGTFNNLFERSQRSVAESVTEGDPLAQALQELARGNRGTFEFRGTATQLRGMLAAVKPINFSGMWPPAPNKLSERLRRIARQLRLTGWQVNPDGRDGTRKNARLIQLAFPDPCSSTSLPEEKEESSEPSDRPISSKGAGL
jgi:hypothetical protein